MGSSGAELPRGLKGEPPVGAEVGPSMTEPVKKALVKTLLNADI